VTTPIVRVIGYTKFLGVPVDLLPAASGEGVGVVNDVAFIADGQSKIAAKGQDKGSELARLIECAGRTCYDSYGVGRPSAEYHDHIKEVGHGSVTEHAVINFYLDNISRGCTHELVRHRAGCAISQRSTRYVDESGSPWILHPLLEKLMDETAPVTPMTATEAPKDKHGNDADIKLRLAVNGSVDIAKATYDSIVEALQGYMIAKGVDKFTARKQARGAARGLLGNALCTSMVWSANIRALRTVIEQRANPAADAEIRVLANRLYEEASKVCPEYFSDYEKVECPDGIGYGLVTKFRKI
jgi:thymidylate synthase (FAD)